MSPGPYLDPYPAQDKRCRLLLVRGANREFSVFTEEHVQVTAELHVSVRWCSGPASSGPTRASLACEASRFLGRQGEILAGCSTPP